MANKTEDKAQQFWYLTFPKIFFILQILVGLFGAYWVLIHHQPQTGDDVEHLHSTWLVFQHKVPYIDFFQHHNPLLWYLFAPLVGFFAYDIAVFDTVRIISTCVMLATLYFSGEIVRRFICKTHSYFATLLTIAAVFPSYVIFSGQDFRPDNYMVFAFILGLHQFFAYLDTHKTKPLVISFVFMFITFMFMQKSIFFLGIFGLMVLYLLWKREVLLPDFMVALVLPLLGAVLFILWLVSHNMLEIYWKANFIFNLYIPDVYNYLVEPTRAEFYVLTALAFVGFIFLMWKGNVAARIVCILWLGEVVQRLFYFSLNRHYYYFLDVLDAILAGAIVYLCIKRWKWSIYFFIVLSLGGCWCFYDYCQWRKLEPNFYRYVTPRYIIQETNKCDTVLNGYGLTYGIFTKDLTYYWNLNGQLDVIGDKIGLAPMPDLNKVVAQYLPKIIYTGIYWNEKMRKLDLFVPVHQINAELRDRFYNQSLFRDIFVLKPEYQNQRRCRYDSATDTWEYFYKE
jgi:hypothetical protein